MKEQEHTTRNKPEAKPGSTPEPKDDLKSLPTPELEARLGSSPDGLAQAEAQKRLSQYGPNEIEEKKTNQFLKFLTYFWGPIPWMIEAAVILSAVARHWPDFGIIFVLLLANAAVGFWEEHQADLTPRDRSTQRLWFQGPTREGERHVMEALPSHR